MRLHHASVVLLISLAVAACARNDGAPAAGGKAGASASREPASPPPDTAPGDATSADRLLLAVNWGDEGEGTASVEAIALIRASGELVQPVVDDSASAASFYARWLNGGHAYPVLRGGRPVGLVTVGENDLQGCAALTATATIRDAPRGFGDVGLATDAVLGNAEVAREATAAERAEVAALLRNAIEAQGGAWSGDTAARVYRIALPGGATAFSSDAVMQVEADAAKPAAALVIAERGADGKLRPAVTWTPPRGQDDAPQYRVFLDAVDLDRDGTPEIVTRSALEESSVYTIYRRTGNRWAEVFNGGGGGC